MTERQIVGAKSVTAGAPLWHYQYKIGQMLHHFDAESFEACVDALMRASARSPQLTSIWIFEGGRRSEVLAEGMRELLAG